jgi:Asp-tRNA(Asn)/Glu-tRNA(Gln) amidotransferase A subunit family amidase
LATHDSAAAPAVTAEDICYLTAGEALVRFRDKDLSPVELLEALIRRSEEVNPKVNAYTYTFYEEALEQAREAEAKYVRGADVRPLEGIACAIKDLHSLEGQIATQGSRVFDGVVAESTIPTVQRLLDAGAIVHARTTTPEFGHASHTHSPLWGVTRNPWNLDYGPAGSSGGSAAAVAAGMTTIADGSDGGGSIRAPSSACGIFGYKPPFGRNPVCLLETNLEMIIHLGPMTRSVADAALMQNVMAGPHVDDITTLKPKLELPASFDGIDGWKIAFSPNLGYVEVDPQVAANTAAAADAFHELGCTVDEVDLGWDARVLDAWTTHWEALFSAALADDLPQWAWDMDRFVRGLLERGLTHSAVRDKRTEFVRTEMWTTLGPILEEYDVLVCPTLAVPSTLADHQLDDPHFQVNGKRVDPYVGWYLTYPFNLLSQCPVASIPTGYASTGVPTGMQIVGRTFDDLSVFRAAAAFESIRPWRQTVPAL